MRNIKLIIAYDGTVYHGFQEQRGSGLKTVQELLEKALSRLSGRPVRVIGAGRTDAGVHARGQVVNFDAAGWSIPVERLTPAVNGVLPPDIAVLKAAEVGSGFHARFSATAKTYCYTIFNCRVRSPFYHRYSLFVPRPLDLASMQAAAGQLVGEHDFASFQAVGTPVKTTVRTLYNATVRPEGYLVYLTFRGNGFLYNMVRIMVGTLLEVGLGKRPAGEMAAILAARDRTRAGPTVPPRGLCLEEVEYEWEGNRLDRAGWQY